MIKKFKFVFLTVVITQLFYSQGVLAETWGISSGSTWHQKTATYFNTSANARSPFEWCENMAASGGWNLKSVEYTANDSWAHCYIEHPTYIHPFFGGNGPFVSIKQSTRRYSRSSSPDIECPEGQGWDEEKSQCSETPYTKCTAGNPIVITTGNKVETELDYSTYMNGHEIRVSRKYQSSRINRIDSRSLRYPWEFSYMDKLVSFEHVSRTQDPTTTNYIIKWKRPFNHEVSFTYPVNTVAATTVVSGEYRLNFVDPGWHILDGHNNSYFFEKGWLSRIVYSDGTEIIIDRSLSSEATVTSMGRELFKYQMDTQGRILSIDANDVTVISYAYDSNNNLYQSIKANGEVKDYLYEDINFPNALTGIYTPDHGQIKTWAYDEKGRAIRSYHGDFKNDTKLIFNDDITGPPVSITVENALNKRTTYHLKPGSKGRLVELVEGEESDNCAAANKAYTYYDTGYIQTKTDWQGRITEYERDALGREIKQINAKGTDDERVTYTEWHPSLNVMTKLIKPKQTTEWEYYENGNLKHIERYETLPPTQPQQ